ncbi:hypothetical protein HDU96_002500 [Phlyctochytrium bullatum]|nr:hypothetical protein HDU96_002500 [Phlyctochytrium bullatum]
MDTANNAMLPEALLASEPTESSELQETSGADRDAEVMNVEGDKIPLENTRRRRKPVVVFDASPSVRNPPPPPVAKKVTAKRPASNAKATSALGTVANETRWNKDLLQSRLLNAVIDPHPEGGRCRDNARKFYETLTTVVRKSLTAWILEQTQTILNACTTDKCGISEDTQIAILGEYKIRCGADDPFSGVYQTVRLRTNSYLVMEIFQCPARNRYAMDLFTFIGQIFIIISRAAEVFYNLTTSETTIVQVESSPYCPALKEVKAKNKDVDADANEDAEKDMEEDAEKVMEEDAEKVTEEAAEKDADEDAEKVTDKDMHEDKEEQCYFEDGEKAAGFNTFRAAHILLVLAMIRSCAGRPITHLQIHGYMVAESLGLREVEGKKENYPHRTVPDLGA